MSLTYPSQVPSGISIVPFSSGTQDLGTTSLYFSNVYVNKVFQTGTSGGGVSGPASTTNSGIAIWANTSGTLLADSQWSISGGDLLPSVSGTQNLGSLANPIFAISISGTINGCINVPHAWVCWDQANSTPTLSGNYNVSSLTDAAVGSTTVNFTTAMADIKYCAVGTSNSGVTMSPILLMTTGCKVNIINAAGTAVDRKINSLMIFSNP